MSYSPFPDGRNGDCYRKPFRHPVCSNFAKTHLDNAVYQRGLHEYTRYIDLDRIWTQNSVRASLQVAGLALSCMSLSYVIALTPLHKRYTTIFRALTAGLLCSIVQQGIGTWVHTSSIRVASYPVLTNDWSSTRPSTTYRANLIVMHTASVMAFGCVQVAMYVQGRSLLSRLKLKYPEYVYTTVLGLLILLSIVAFIYHMGFQGYQMFWYGFTPAGVQFEAIPSHWWYLMLHLGSVVLVNVSLGLWALVVAQSTLTVLWDRREILFEERFSGKELKMAGAPVVRAGNLPSKKKRRSKAGNVFEGVLTLMGLIAFESFIAPMVVIMCSSLYFSQYQFENLLTSVLLVLLPMSSLFVNLSGQEEAKSPAAEGAQRAGYPASQSLLGVERNVVHPQSYPLGQIVELDEHTSQSSSSKH